MNFIHIFFKTTALGLLASFVLNTTVNASTRRFAKPHLLETSLGNGDSSSKSPAHKKYVIAYVGGYAGVAVTSGIKASELTGINYAFVNILNNRAWLANEKTDTVNFRKLTELKKINPDLKLMISIGGWDWSGRFSDAVLSDSSRKGFARSSVAIVGKYDLDGVDIDWEYPALHGHEGNIYRPEDTKNYTQMFVELRHSLDSLALITHKKYLLSTAVGGSTRFIQHTEMAKVAQICDYINLMSYDYSSDSISEHHTNLYASKGKNTKGTHRSVTEYIAAGVPAEKLNMGVAMYGKRSTVTETKKNGLHQPFTVKPQDVDYIYIKDSLVNQKGYKEYWDRHAKAPYLFNKETKQFVTYDSERSIMEKCKYVDDHNLGGMMFWEYASDPKGYLLDEINKDLKK